MGLGHSRTQQNYRQQQQQYEDDELLVVITPHIISRSMGQNSEVYLSK
jgi:hypothetical protein